MSGRDVGLVSIAGRGSIGGQTVSLTRGPLYLRRVDLEDNVVVLLAGRAAEDRLLGAASSGAAADLARATVLLVRAHALHGLGDSLLSAGHGDDPALLLRSDHALRRAVERHLHCLYARALDLIDRHRRAVEAIADALLQHRFLDGDAAAKIFRDGSPGSGTRPNPVIHRSAR